MGQLGHKNFQEYLDMLRANPEECTILGKEFLIGVTKFFRDQAAFDVLREEVLPLIMQSKGDHDVLKVWVTACSSGQEAYSIAMLLNEFLASHSKHIEIKIFATDIDADAIEYAAKGVYPKSTVEDMDPYLLRKYFTEQNGQGKILLSSRMMW
jgi:two-component system CheB/CheR fusion protein